MSQENVDPSGLELIFEESRDAHAKLMADIDSLDTKADRIVQTNLVIIGILLGIASSDLSKSWTIPMWIAVFVAIFVFALSGIWAAWVGMPQKFYTGTIFPHIMQKMVNNKPEDIRLQLIDSLARSYYHNQQAFLKRARSVKIAGTMQLLAMLALVVVILITVIDLVIA